MTDYNDKSKWYIVTDRNEVKVNKQRLERSGEFDKSRRIETLNGVFYLPIGTDSSTVDPLTTKLRQSRYTIYPPMVLFNSTNSWTDEECKELVENNNRYFGRSDITHLALNAPLNKDDEKRSPTQLRPLYGDFGNLDSNFENAFWCSCVQNGIKQIWAPLHTMFSRGNIHEKSRVLTFSDIENNDIIDLYCGIGYFTFSYALRGARRIFAWDINAWSIEGLLRGAECNKFTAKKIEKNELINSSIQINAFLEDNMHSYDRLVGLDHLRITHINMGLLPDCRNAWELAIKLATMKNNDSRKITLHIHENVAENDIEQWRKDTKIRLNELSDCETNIIDEHVEKIKTFAPGVWHICGDFVIHR